MFLALHCRYVASLVDGAKPTIKNLSEWRLSSVVVKHSHVVASLPQSIIIISVRTWQRGHCEAWEQRINMLQWIPRVQLKVIYAGERTRQQWFANVNCFGPLAAIHDSTTLSSDFHRGCAAELILSSVNCLQSVSLYHSIRSCAAITITLKY